MDTTNWILAADDCHEYIEKAYNAIKPGLDDNQGKLILTSTINPAWMGSLFQTIFHNAPSNHYSAKFYGWEARPDRTAEWYQTTREEYDDLASFEKEFPKNEEEAFSPAKTLAFFDRDILMDMKEDTRKPVEVFFTENNVEVNIYQTFQVGMRYASATDSGHGIGQ